MATKSPPPPTFSAGQWNQDEETSIANSRSTLGMFGSGYVEMLARLITADLRAIRDSVPPGESKPLVSKGISFGAIVGRRWKLGCLQDRRSFRAQRGDRVVLLQLHKYRVHCNRMKNVTLSADEDLLEQARLVARSQHKTLNAAFREWLLQYTAQAGGSKEFRSLMQRLQHVRAGRRFSCDELNER